MRVEGRCEVLSDVKEVLKKGSHGGGGGGGQRITIAVNAGVARQQLCRRTNIHVDIRDGPLRDSR